jgi:hypothetical protein
MKLLSWDQWQTGAKDEEGYNVIILWSAIALEEILVYVEGNLYPRISLLEKRRDHTPTYRCRVPLAP